MYSYIQYYYISYFVFCHCYASFINMFFCFFLFSVKVLPGFFVVLSGQSHNYHHYKWAFWFTCCGGSIGIFPSSIHFSPAPPLLVEQFHLMSMCIPMCSWAHEVKVYLHVGTQGMVLNLSSILRWICLSLLPGPIYAVTAWLQAFVCLNAVKHGHVFGSLIHHSSKPPLYRPPIYIFVLSFGTFFLPSPSVLMANPAFFFPVRGVFYAPLSSCPPGTHWAWQHPTFMKIWLQLSNVRINYDLYASMETVYRKHKLDSKCKKRYKNLYLKILERRISERHPKMLRH